MLKPYKEKKNNPRRCVRYNGAHSATRVLVEHANGRLKSAWRRLRHIDVRDRARARLIIRCCLILHNFVLHHDCDVDREEHGRIMERLTFDSAISKREAICKYYFKKIYDQDTILDGH